MPQDSSDSDKEKSDSTLMTSTPTMRRKADAVGKCVLCILKWLRFCKCTKTSIEPTKKDTKNAN